MSHDPYVLTTVTDENHLRTLPDGTIISWLRLPGDPTSEAVAFVRREVENLGPCGPYDASGVDCGQRVTVWISPGGWAPQTVASAGVTFPCQVVRFGDYQASQYLGSELPYMALPPELPALAVPDMHGGTWSREAALAAAAQLWQGRGGPGAVLNLMADADQLEGWLDRPEPMEAVTDELLLGEVANTLRKLKDRGLTVESANYVIGQVYA